MKWTRAKPTAPGFYWYRGDWHPRTTLVDVKSWDDEPLRVYWLVDNDDDGDRLEDLDGEWAGPLSPPEE